MPNATLAHNDDSLGLGATSKRRNANVGCFNALRSWCTRVRRRSRTHSAVCSCAARRTTSGSSTATHSHKSSDIPTVLVQDGDRDPFTGLTPYEAVMVAATAARTGSALASRCCTPSIHVHSCSSESSQPDGVASESAQPAAPAPAPLEVQLQASTDGIGVPIPATMMCIELKSPSTMPVKTSTSMLFFNEPDLQRAPSCRSLMDDAKKVKKSESKFSHNLSIKSILKRGSSKRKDKDKDRPRASSEALKNDAGCGVGSLPPVILISRSNNFDENNAHGARSVMSGLVLHNCQRRESFLYKSDSEFSQSPSVSRHSSIAGTEGEDYIVTPFAQILATLKNVRSSYLAITNLQVPPKPCKASQHSMASQVAAAAAAAAAAAVKHQDVLHKITNDECFAKVVGETLEELDWCLEQLESLQTQRSVSELASNKFKRLLTKELSLVEEQTAAGMQISKYICNTFLDKSTEIDLQQHSDRQPTLPEMSPSNGQQSFNGLPSQETCLTQTTQPAPASVTLSRLVVSSVSQIEGSTDKPLLCPYPIDPGSADETETSVSMQQLGVETPKHEELSVLLDNGLEKWGINMFEVASLSANRPITVMLYTIFDRRGFMRTFKIEPAVLINCAALIEFNYHDVPYHNRIHGADVTQSINVLLSGPTLANVFTELEQMAALFAGAVHDVDHPGYTNQFLINSGNELALMYNDESVLENHHLAVAFKVLQSTDSDPFRNLTSKQRQTFRRMVIDMVLATDMQKHMKLLADLKTMVETKRVSGAGIVRLDNYTDRIQILQNLVHCADLANPTKPLDIYLRWVDCIMEEFWRQGDTERERKLEISPMCDRHSANVDKSQTSFIDFIVHPLWETWCELVYPDAQEILDMLDENREWYQNKIHASSSISQSHNAQSISDAHSTENTCDQIPTTAAVNDVPVNNLSSSVEQAD